MSGYIPLLPRVSSWVEEKVLYFTCSEAESYVARSQTKKTAVQRFAGRVHVPTYEFVHLRILLFVCM
jgi:AMMECR1 domain-containing protein